MRELYLSPQERHARAEAFDAKQAKAHADAEQRKRREVEELQKRAEAEASKDEEARKHTVPPRPTVASCLPSLE